MRKFRLNRWQRIGIVLSGLWAIVGTIWAQRVLFPIDLYSKCIDAGVTDAAFCRRIYDAHVANAEKYQLGVTLIYAVVPVAIAWLLVYVVLWAVRWIRGDRPQQTG